MRTFLSRDAKSGFAIKGDDVVSLFKHPSSTAKHVADAALKQAIANGGRRLDAFDTLLPGMYAKSGFRAVARLKWDDKHAPAGWDKETFKEFNKGEPDVVFMVHDAEHAGKYKPGDGKRVKSYDEGKAEQDKALAKIHAHPGAGYSKDSWVDQKGVIHTDNVHDAAYALFQNKKVELHQIKQVSTLIHELGAQAKSWQQQGKEAPVFNLCNVSVEGTNLFCAESKGVPRVEMPVIPAKRTKDFIKYLRGQGYNVEKDTERADHLRATQSEISGAKVAASMDRIEKEGFYKRLVVSRDDYILDGHHTWAGEIGVEASKGTLGDEKTVKIARVDISITKLIDEANKWMKEQGLAKKPASEAAKTLGEVIREWFERQPGHDVSDEPRDESGRWTEGGGGGDGAAPEAPKSDEDMRLVGSGVDKTRIENWRKELEGQLDKLEKEGKAGEAEWDKINRMEISLGFYLNASEKDKANGHASLVEIHDGNNKLLATVFTQFNPKNRASVIEGIGGLEKAALTKALEHTILHEREGNKSERIEKVEFADNADTIAAMKAAGFRQEKMQTEGVVRMVHGANETSAERALPEFGDYAINVIMPKGLSRSYQADVANALDQVPAPAMKTLADAGVALHSGRNLTTIFPDLHDRQPRGWSAGGTWDQADGMFDPATAQIITTEFYRNSKGDLVKGGRTQGVVLHESGHAFDYANGTPSDNSPSFVAAYREDHEKIPENDRRNSRLSYFTPEGQGHGETEAIKYLNAARAARSETFAEIFAWTVGQQGSSWEDIRKDFPRVSEMMKQAVKTGRMKLT